MSAAKESEKGFDFTTSSEAEGVVVAPGEAPPQDQQEFSFILSDGTKLEQKGTGVNAEVADLVRRFSPIFVSFKEDLDAAAAPYPYGRHDYHPRPVQLFLGGARAVPVMYTSWARILGFLALIAGLIIGVYVLVGYLGMGDSFDITFWAPQAVVGVVILLVAWIHFLRQPKGEEKIRSSLTEFLRDGIPGLVLTTFAPRPAAGSSDKAWKDYRRALESTPDSGRTVYLRVVRGSGLSNLILQFWVFYYYNDWWNQHQSDWECTMLFFGEAAGEPASASPKRPVACAYSNHLGALWRKWPEVRRWETGDDEDHPLVYVARGSHAQYFYPRRGGYDTAHLGPVPNPFLDLRYFVRRKKSIGRERDYVPQVAIKATDPITDSWRETYKIETFPSRVEFVDPSDDPRIWERWWWIRFRGKWSASGLFSWMSTYGPACQTEKWDSPFSWVGELGRADGTWEDLFELDD